MTKIKSDFLKDLHNNNLDGTRTKFASKHKVNLMPYQQPAEPLS